VHIVSTGKNKNDETTRKIILDTTAGFGVVYVGRAVVLLRVG
jgi:hypothetical protein